MKKEPTRNAKEIVGHLYNDHFVRNQKKQEMVSNDIIEKKKLTTTATSNINIAK